MTNSTKGSEWRKWDLHFHTPSSYDYKDNSITNESIIDGLVQNSIEVIAITDHHLIDTERVRALQEIGKSKGVTVLPGIEFLSDARGSEPIHFIGIFSERCNLDHIWGQIKNRTEINRIEGEGKKHNEVYCNLIETAKLIKLLGGIVSIHAGTKSNGIENITNSLDHAIAQKQDIAEVIDIFELGKESDIDGYQKHVNPFLHRTIGKKLPLIICSDNHDITNYEIKQNLWIKADPTFEGLKQIIYEPEQRIKIQFQKPDFKEEKLIIDEVRYLSSNNLFSPTPIKLNKNLNVIIGGKSSGKSILLYHIASTLETNGEVVKIAHDKYDFRRSDDSFDFEVKISSGITQKLHDNSETSIIPNIKYIPQNYLSKLAEPKENKKSEDLLNYVRGLLLENDIYKSKYQEFIAKLKVNDKQRNDSIDRYFIIKDYILKLEKDLKERGNEIVLNQSIKSNTERIGQLKKGGGLSDEQIKVYDAKKKELEEVQQEIEKVKNDFRKFSSFNRDIINTIKDTINQKELIAKSFELDRVKTLFDSKYNFLYENLKELEKFRKSIEIVDRKFTNDNEFKTVLGELRTKEAKLLNDLKPFQTNLKIQKEVSDIEKIISDDKKKLSSIAQLKKEIQNNKVELEKEKNKVFDQYKENYSLYPEIVKVLSERADISEDENLTIEGSTKFNCRKFNKSIRNISDMRSFSDSEHTLFQIKHDLINFDGAVHNQELRELFNSIAERNDYPLSSKISQKDAVKILLDDYFVDYWETLYYGDKMDKMSTGKASFVILMLIIGLSSSKAPILIDQPEDNLDNRSITRDLVKYLRNKKLERQIILVTHNPNVVVNADSENVIVSNQKGQNDRDTSSIYTFDYINGAIENTAKINPDENDLLKSMGIREHIAEIVEGGKEAFKKREEKYGF